MILYLTNEKGEIKMAKHQKFSTVKYEYNTEILNSYYSSLVIGDYEALTKEKIEEIMSVAKYCNASKKGTWYDETIEVKFFEIIDKLRLLKDNRLFYTITNFGHQHDNIEYPNIILETDIEKILFIIAYCDPNNILLSTWLNTKQNIINNSGESVLSSGNYVKAKTIMQTYFDGFFNLKLILDEERLLSRITELEAQHEVNTTRK